MPPTILQKIELEVKVQALVEELATWICKYGKFTKAGIPLFDECENEDLEKKVAPFWQEGIAILREVRTSAGLNPGVSHTYNQVAFSIDMDHRHLNTMGYLGRCLEEEN